MSTPLTEASFWILTALAGEPRHGYAILREVDSLSGGAVTLRVTTLYAALDRLEQSGLIQTSGEEVVDGRARRYYRLAERGASDLAAETLRLQSRARVAQERLAVRPVPATFVVAPA